MRKSEAAGGGVATADREIAEVNTGQSVAALPEPENPTAAGGIARVFSETNLAIAVLTIVYVMVIGRFITSRLWFDELFTYYIAQAPTLSRLMEAMAHVDLNPPLGYLAVRLCHELFGNSEFATRLPSALGFYLGSMGAFVFLKRRIAVWWSAVAILLFWCTPYMRYATQARPYGLLLGFFALTLLSFDKTSFDKTSFEKSGQARRNPWAVAGVAAGNVGMMLSHMFAPLSIFPFCAAEAVRCVIRRRIDWAVWMALLLPLGISLAFIPAMHTFGKIYFPESYQASGPQAAYFFVRLLLFYGLPTLTAFLLALVVVPYSTATSRKIPAGWPAFAWAASILLAPVILNWVMMRTAGAFWERYCITTALAFYMFSAIAMARVTRFRTGSGVVAAITLCVVALFDHRVPDSETPVRSAMTAIPRDLPLVAEDGLTFLEMDHYEGGDFKSGLYYLVDRDAAIQYAHSTIFENFPLLAHYFPLRSQVVPYDAFVSAHPHFMVLAKFGYREVWVLKKLRHDGAQITFRRSLRGPVKDFQLYEVESRVK